MLNLLCPSPAGNLNGLYQELCWALWPFISLRSHLCHLSPPSDQRNINLFSTHFQSPQAKARKWTLNLKYHCANNQKFSLVEVPCYKKTPKSGKEKSAGKSSHRYIEKEQGYAYLNNLKLAKIKYSCIWKGWGGRSRKCEEKIQNIYWKGGKGNSN